MALNLQSETRPGQARNTALDQQMRQIEQAVNALTAAQSPAVRIVSASASVLDTDEYVFVDASAGNVKIGLPAALTRRRIGVCKTDASVNTVTIVANGSELIDGAATKVLTAQFEAYPLVSSGGNFWIVF